MAFLQAVALVAAIVCCAVVMLSIPIGLFGLWRITTWALEDFLRARERRAQLRRAPWLAPWEVR